MSDQDLQQLYQQKVLDHGRNPRNYKVLENATHVTQGHNPLCGDRFTLYLNWSNEQIHDASFHGDGCAIAFASASMMTEHIQGLSTEEAKKVTQHIQQMFDPRAKTLSEETLASLGELAVFSSMVHYPARIKCASLIWHALDATLQGKQETVSTE